MSNDDFDTAGEYVAMKDLLGELVLFTPVEYVEEFQTDFGTKDAVITGLVVLTQDGQPEYQDVMIFQGSLIGQLKRRIPVDGGTMRNADGSTRVVSPRAGKKLLGTIAKGEAKKGQNAPYILLAPDDAQKQMARDYLAGRTVDTAAAQATAPVEDDPFAVKPKA